MAEDGQAYRVNAAGSPLWSAQLGGRGLHLLAADFGPGDPRLFAATQEGAVLRLDPLTGSVLWSTPVATDVARLESVAALAAQPSRGRLLVGTSAGALVALDAGTGARASEASLPLPLEGPLVQVDVGAEGDVLVARSGGVALLSADLAPAAERALDGVVGFARAPGRVLVATGAAAHDLSLPSLAPGGEAPFAREAALSAAGDATGDGVPDLVVALKDLGVVAVSGATGETAWTRQAGAWVKPVPSAVPFRPDDAWKLLGGGPLCASPEATYQTAHEACAWDAGRGQSEPLLLEVGGGRVHFAHVHHGNPYLDGLDASGRLVAQAFLPSVPDALASGAWATGGRAVAVAGADGTIDLYRDDAWASPALRVRATDFVGRFTFFTPVPGGGFFGTHLLVATLGWTEQGATREARLFDWFEVVGSDGKPVLEPSYRVVLVVQDRGDPVGG